MTKKWTHKDAKATIKMAILTEHTKIQGKIVVLVIHKITLQCCRLQASNIASVGQTNSLFVKILLVLSSD